MRQGWYQLEPLRLLPTLMLMAILAPPAKAQDPSLLVRVDSVIREPLSQTVPVIGRLVAQQAGMVSAIINGPVEAFFVEVGDRVEQGQVVAVLHANSHRARRDLAAGELAEARAMLETKKAELALSAQELKRLERLKKSAAFSQARYDDARQNVVIAKAEVTRAEAAILSAKADLEAKEIDLDNTNIRAPYDGVVTHRLTEAGSYLQVGAAVLQLVAADRLEIEADVPYQRLSGISVGAGVDFALDDGSRHRAQVRAVLPQENPLTRTRVVRLVPKFGRHDKPLASGQSVTIELPIGRPREVVTVHKDAVIKRGPTSVVFVVVDGAAQSRTVQLGEAIGSRFEVISGLAEGDSVVIRGNERLRPGDKVRVDGASG